MPRDVLDVGCGEGQVARLVAARRAGPPAGSSASTRRGPRSRSPPSGPAARPTPARAPAALPFAAGTFDAVVACLVFEHIRDVDDAIAEVARVLRPGGRFAFFLNHPLLQTPSSGWIDDQILDPPEQYWRIGPYLVEDETIEEVEKDVFIPFIHRPLCALRQRHGRHGLLIHHMDEPAPPPGFLALAEEYAEAATIPACCSWSPSKADEREPTPNIRYDSGRDGAKPGRAAQLMTDILVITGLSGAGRSQAADDLEDLGWFVVDNLPDVAHREGGRAGRRPRVDHRPPRPRRGQRRPPGRHHRRRRRGCGPTATGSASCSSRRPPPRS